MNAAPTDGAPPSRPSSGLKRKRSSSTDVHAQCPAVPGKMGRTQSHLQINYLARQYSHDLPLVSNADTLPSILTLLNEYQGVLERHESMAGNLGARPLGPILMKRFERLFDGPPNILKCHGKDGVSLTWLDVVEFARKKPEQFVLAQMSEGHKVCQFYTKQCRVQISEEDWVLIGSGMPQKLIPPQPIGEDEEKELETLDVLERHLGHICQLADQVAARTRQLNHRLKGRKQAIQDRRATGGTISCPDAPRPPSPSNIALMNGITVSATCADDPKYSSHPSTAGFVAVNQRYDGGPTNSEPHSPGPRPSLGPDGYSSTNVSVLSPPTQETRYISYGDRPRQQLPVVNGELRGSPALTDGRSAAFATSSLQSPSANSPPGSTIAKPLHCGPNNYRLPPFALASDVNAYHPVLPPISPSTPSGALYPLVAPFSSPSTFLHSTLSRSSSANLGGNSYSREDDGPFKAIMVQRVEALGKGDRIIPPCDRCRRLHMDCVKNLTACLGCTRKHAKCSWREIREDEVGGLGTVQAPSLESRDGHGQPGYVGAYAYEQHRRSGAQLDEPRLPATEMVGHRRSEEERYGGHIDGKRPHDVDD